MTFIVGHSPWHADLGLLDFAAQLARVEGESLRVVVVVPDAWPTPVAGDTDRDYQLWSGSPAGPCPGFSSRRPRNTAQP